MDAVYIVRPGDDNEELRYSLRSVTNLPINNVHIVGCKPRWVTGVNHIPTEQPHPTDRATKLLNARKNMLAAMHSNDIEEEFILMNDDFYVMKPQDTLSEFHRGTWAQALEELPAGFCARPYWQGFRATVTVLNDLGYDNPLCYSLHIPIVIKKDFYKEAMRVTAPPFWSAPLSPHIRTVYGNLANLGGTKIRDVKWYGNEGVDKEFRNQDFTSSMDSYFRRSPKGAYVRNAFSDPSRFEVQ